MIKDFLMEHGEYRDDLDFKNLTSIKMGGHIKHFVMPYTIDDLKVIISYLKTEHIHFKIIGNGSNLICGDSEYDGVVVSLKKLDGYTIKNDSVYAEAGVLVPYLANVLAKEGLSALEFASGIPGNIGGLTYMNAGAYKKCMADIIKRVYVLKDDTLIWLENEECEFAYRNSIFHYHPRWVVVAVEFKVEKKASEEIFDLMADRLRRRRESQPLDMLSAGSAFRNPEGKCAWELIDGIGYRGYRVNNVEVSSKHSNFIVNLGGGSAKDYLGIVYDIQNKVYDKYRVKLIMEVEKFNC